MVCFYPLIVRTATKGILCILNHHHTKAVILKTTLISNSPCMLQPQHSCFIQKGKTCIHKQPVGIKTLYSGFLFNSNFGAHICSESLLQNVFKSLNGSVYPHWIWTWCLVCCHKQNDFCVTPQHDCLHTFQAVLTVCNCTGGSKDKAVFPYKPV